MPQPPEKLPHRSITEFVPGPASAAMVSLSQAILAPLDALAKGQVHAARSFLSFLLQIGYPHQPYKGEGEADSPVGGGAPPEESAGKSDVPYSMKFRLEQPDGTGQKKFMEVSIPTLALVPLQPLGIESADYSVELVIKEIDHHRQMQLSEEKALRLEKTPTGVDTDDSLKHQPRPWYLVSDPVSLRGTLSDPGGDGQTQRQASIKVNVKITRSPTPTGLSKLLTAMTQSLEMTESERP